MTVSVENNALANLENRTGKAGQHGRPEQAGRGVARGVDSAQTGPGDDRVSFAGNALQRADQLQPPRLSLQSSERAQEVVANLTEQFAANPHGALSAHTGGVGQDLAALLRRP
jgi:hypothetical protein